MKCTNKELLTFRAASPYHRFDLPELCTWNICHQHYGTSVCVAQNSLNITELDIRSLNYKLQLSVAVTWMLGGNICLFYNFSGWYNMLSVSQANNRHRVLSVW